MNESIEKLRILTETTFEDFPLVSIAAWTTQAIKDFEQLEKENAELREKNNQIAIQLGSYQELVKVLNFYAKPKNWTTTVSVKECEDGTTNATYHGEPVAHSDHGVKAKEALAAQYLPEKKE